MAYLFTKKEKDPIIDVVRTCIEIFKARNNLRSMRQAIIAVAKFATYGSGNQVSPTTIEGWLYRGVISPRFCTAMAVVHATGNIIVSNGRGVSHKPRFPRLKVIRGGKAA